MAWIITFEPGIVIQAEIAMIWGNRTLSHFSVLPDNHDDHNQIVLVQPVRSQIVLSRSQEKKTLEVKDAGKKKYGNRKKWMNG